MKQADDIIIDLVNPNARVLDLGCGDGDLLCRLRQTKSVTGYGVEIEHHRIEGCLERGVNVIEHDIDSGLERFPTNSFDIVIMNETLQAISEPRTLVREMLRIGEECIVTFPNFAYWQCRKQLFFGGRMPVSKHRFTISTRCANQKTSVLSHGMCSIRMDVKRSLRRCSATF